MSRSFEANDIPNVCEPKTMTKLIPVIWHLSSPHKKDPLHLRPTIATMRPLFLILILVLPVFMAKSWCATPTCFSENGIMVEVPRRSIDGVIIRDSLALNSGAEPDMNAWSKLYRRKGPIHK
uniref:Uncharacterized protein n=1 Tax=Steinernema glaseri TaxID=37863 RepID=A0A1I7ZZ17_9BILA